MINAYLVWRFLKFLSLCLLAGGVFSSVFSNHTERRMRALAVTTAGLFGVWFCGYALLKLSGRSLSEAWVLVAMAASIVLHFCVARMAHVPGAGRLSAGFALASLFLAVGVMSLRAVDLTGIAALGGIAGGVAAMITGIAGDPRRRAPAAASIADPSRAARLGSWSWFVWLARLEGLSLILMLLVSMPLRRFAGISLDGGTGLLAWAHGALLLFYLQAVYSTGSILQWSWKRRALGFLLGLLPAGTFLFEYIVRESRVRESQESAEELGDPAV
ncbi:MAG: DUF3817 domain-containing protein [bacterium]|nr:DUF3817 domain-containing protein [bacterium]